MLAGWRVSAEQQISDMELQKLKGGADGRQVKGQAPSPTWENMKEAAYSIYEQYLSEKVKICIIGQGVSLQDKHLFVHSYSSYLSWMQKATDFKVMSLWALSVPISVAVDLFFMFWVFLHFFYLRVK
jgi:hypothetical protein